MAHNDWCGQPCGECNDPCKLDQNIPCSPCCDNLNGDGSRDILACIDSGCDAICENDEESEILISEVRRQISNDDCNPIKAGRALVRAYLAGDVNGILNALCGWDMDYLVELAFNEEM